MINSGTEDIHIDPYTHTKNYSSEPLVVVCYSCLLRDMLQIPEVRLIGIPVNQQLVHYASYLVPGIVLFSRSRIPASL